MILGPVEAFEKTGLYFACVCMCTFIQEALEKLQDLVMAANCLLHVYALPRGDRPTNYSLTIRLIQTIITLELAPSMATSANLIKLFFQNGNFEFRPHNNYFNFST